jgi:C-terminal processing protease CtpA/Prc
MTDEKDDPVPEDVAPVIEWIDSKMRTNYLWYTDIPERSKLDYKQEPDAFFTKLLSSKDGKMKNDTHYYYSTIIKKKEATKAYQGDDLSLGFEYQYYYIQDLKKYALRVLYIIPDSPASEEDIRRGDWIYEINGSPVSDALIAQLNSGAEIQLGISDKRDSKISRQPTLSARAVEDSPVYLSKVIRSGNKRIGYLVYNHFTAGPKEDGTDETFNNELRTVFAQFKGEQPDEFILDLRYNGGGIVTSSQLLATMLAPESALDDVFCKLTYNGQSGAQKEYTLKLAKDYMTSGVQGANLNLKRLYVITSSRTASASEAVINGLKPYMEVILVGEQTEGKNVGSVAYDDDRFEWELHPIVCALSNRAGFSDYAGGFPPDHACSEAEESTFTELGDNDEYLLHKVVQLITTGSFPTDQTSLRATTDRPDIIPLGSSLDRRKAHGVILPASYGR